MAQIKQIGPGRKTTGTIDGVTYVTRNGKTYVRSAPTMPASAYKTPSAKKRQAIFKFIQMHMKYHLRTIKQTFTNNGNGSPANRYYSVNGKALTLALSTLAENYLSGELVTIAEIEAAISAYAALHPQAIVIASKSGYKEVYLTGEWPANITLNALTGDSTVIIIVNEYGEQTTINADGTVSVSGNANGNENQNGSLNNGGSSSGSGTNGNQNENQNQGSGTPKLTINKSGTGTATVSVGGNAVNSGAEIAADTEVSISVTPAEGATPTATINGSSVILTESEGIYTGTFTMPSASATLIINTGGSSGGVDQN